MVAVVDVACGPIHAGSKGRGSDQPAQSRLRQAQSADRPQPVEGRAGSLGLQPLGLDSKPLCNTQVLEGWHHRQLQHWPPGPTLFVAVGCDPFACTG